MRKAREPRMQVQTITHVQRAAGSEFYYEIAHHNAESKQDARLEFRSSLEQCDYYYIIQMQNVRARCRFVISFVPQLFSGANE
jgi:hypothetical protein